MVNYPYFCITVMDQRLMQASRCISSHVLLHLLLVFLCMSDKWYWLLVNVSKISIGSSWCFWFLCMVGIAWGSVVPVHGRDCLRIWFSCQYLDCSQDTLKKSYSHSYGLLLHVLLTSQFLNQRYEHTHVKPAQSRWENLEWHILAYVWWRFVNL